MTFIGLIVSGIEAKIHSKILRSSSSSSIIEVQLIQNGEIQTTIVACFGISRSSMIKIDPHYDKPNLKPRKN